MFETLYPENLRVLSVASDYDLVSMFTFIISMLSFGVLQMILVQLMQTVSSSSLQPQYCHDIT